MKKTSSSKSLPVLFPLLFLRTLTGKGGALLQKINATCCRTGLWNKGYSLEVSHTWTLAAAQEVVILYTSFVSRAKHMSTTTQDRIHKPCGNAEKYEKLVAASGRCVFAREPLCARSERGRERPGTGSRAKALTGGCITC